MGRIYGNILLTIITASLVAIVAKLYLPQAEHIGPRIALPRYGDLLALASVSDTAVRKQALQELIRNLPLVRVQGGDIDVSGTVSVEGTVDVGGSVSIDGPVEIEH